MQYVNGLCSVFRGTGVDAVDGGLDQPVAYPHLDGEAWAEDLSDAMSAQSQMNQMRRDLSQAVTECQHWKKLAQVCVPPGIFFSNMTVLQSVWFSWHLCTA